MQCHTQAVNITINPKVQVYFTLPALSATNFVRWNFHVDDSIKFRYYIILRRGILTALGLNSKLSEHVIEAGDGPFKGSTISMVGLGM